MSKFQIDDLVSFRGLKFRVRDILRSTRDPSKDLLFPKTGDTGPVRAEFCTLVEKT